MAASARVCPCDTHPGKDGQQATKTPSSSCSISTLNRTTKPYHETAALVRSTGLRVMAGGWIPPRAINSAGLILAGLSFARLWAGRASIHALAVGVALLDAGQRSSHLANQSVIFGLSPKGRNRLNAVYMVIFFIGVTHAAALWPCASDQNGGATKSPQHEALPSERRAQT